MPATATTHEPPTDPAYDNFDYPIISPSNQSGHPGHTTKEQDAKVHQLRMMLEQAGYKERLDVLTMLRFLRARKFDVNLTKAMFIECEKWRKEFGGGVENLTRDFDYQERPKVFEYYPQYYHKTDKDGRPLYIEQLGKIDLAALYKITTQERMLSNLVVEYEKVADPRLPACSRKHGHLLETCCTILDLKGLGISTASNYYSYIQSASVLSQNYYPERLGKLFVINAPWGFSPAFSVVKRFLDPVTVSKINVLGTNYKAELLKQVPEENLPEMFGGTCKCEGGCPFADSGPWQDKEFTRTPAWAKEKQDTEVITNKAAEAEERPVANPIGRVVGNNDAGATPVANNAGPTPAPAGGDSDAGAKATQ